MAPESGLDILFVGGALLSLVSGSASLLRSVRGYISSIDYHRLQRYSGGQKGAAYAVQLPLGHRRVAKVPVTGNAYHLDRPLAPVGEGNGRVGMIDQNATVTSLSYNTPTKHSRKLSTWIYVLFMYNHNNEFDVRETRTRDQNNLYVAEEHETRSEGISPTGSNLLSLGPQDLGPRPLPRVTFSTKRVNLARHVGEGLKDSLGTFVVGLIPGYRDDEDLKSCGTESVTNLAVFLAGHITWQAERSDLWDNKGGHLC